jgi:hypothetical protein
VFVANNTSFTLGNVTINSGGTAPAASTLQGYNAAGTNVAGGDLSINGGAGTGSGVSGIVRIKIAPNSASGSGSNALANAAVFAKESYTIGGWSTVSGGAIPAASWISGVWANGTDTVGGDFSVYGGKGTGAGTGGNVNFYVAPAASAGAGQNSHVLAGQFTHTRMLLGGWSTVSGGTAPGGSTISGVNATGTNIAGGDMSVSAGKGTGSGGSSLLFYVAPNQGAGAGVNPLVAAATFNGTSVALGGWSTVSGGAAPTNSSLSGIHGVGTDIAGGHLYLSSGKGSGAGDSGQIVFQVAPDQATGTGVNPYVTAGAINQTSVTFGAFSTVSGGTAPTASTYAGVHGVGTDIAGGAASFDGGKGTGTGAPGAVTIKVAPNQATGTGVNPYVTAATINGTSVTMGNFTTVSGGTAPTASIYAGVNAAGTDIAGGSATVQTGTGTGTGAAQSVTLKSTPVLTTGTTPRPSTPMPSGARSPTPWPTTWRWACSP